MLSVESTVGVSARMVMAKAKSDLELERKRCTVPPTTKDCVNREIQLEQEIE